MNSAKLFDAIDEFRSEISSKVEDNQSYLVMMKAKLNNSLNNPILDSSTSSSSIRSISYMQRFKKGGLEEENMDMIFEWFWNAKEQYHKLDVDGFIFTYCPISKATEEELAEQINSDELAPKTLSEEVNLLEETQLLLKEQNIKSKEQILKYQGMILPDTMDLTKWGTFHFTTDYKTALIIPNNNIKKLNKKYDSSIVKTWLNSIDLNKDIIESSLNNYQTYGNLLINTNIQHLKIYTQPYYLIEILNNTTIYVEVRSVNYVLFSFIDKLIVNEKTRSGCSLDLNSFTRKIVGKKTTYIYTNNERKMALVERKTPFITSKKKDQYTTQKYLTMDLETRVVNSKMIPYCISIYDGSSIYNYYLTDFENVDHMIKTALTRLFSAKYHTWNVYIHNFSYFDGILLLGTIAEIASDVNIIMRENSIINVQVKFDIIDSKGNTKVNYINFRDSYNLLPSSLNKLAISFGVSKKGIFPYKFINENNDLNYIGSVPNYNYFEKTVVSLEDYNNYKEDFNNNMWNIRTETVKYCNQDVVTLHEVINSFSYYIFDKFNINIHRTPTISSLAFVIFRSNFLDSKKVQIPVLTGELYKDIRMSYIGGLVDVYKPIATNIMEYDVNSLYPFVMKEQMMPVGKPVYFEGNLDDVKELDFSELENKDLLNPFGFFFVEVESPLDINVPILPVKKIDFRTGNHTVTPIGKWTGWYFSEEINNAKKYGYKFNILKGYLFEKQNIFKDYVDFLYGIKKEYSNDSKHPLYLIVKLLLNSLYGKFGMNPVLESHTIINNDKIVEFSVFNKITSQTSLSNELSLISYFKKDFIKNSKLNIKDSSIKEGVKNVSISIASAVTAYARNYMSFFKAEQDGLHLYYTDTDSIFTSKPLDPQFVGAELGQFKHVNEIEQGVFLAPKTYAIVAKTGENKLERQLIVKFKGLQVKKLDTPISIDKMLDLLIKDHSLSITQEKWFRDIGKGEITVKQSDFNYKLKPDSKNLKREMIYENDKFINTKPIKIDYKLTADNSQKTVHEK